MKILLLRHGTTEYNVEKRYQGFSDIPLSIQGENDIIAAPFTPKKVFVSPLQRARRTCQLIFPNSTQIPVDGLKEMNFGIFEGHNYIEMENWKSYRDWVEGGGIGLCPEGEDYTMFCNRVCPTFKSLLNDAFKNDEAYLVIVAHAGVQMAVMEHFSSKQLNSRHEWIGPHAGGYLLETDHEQWYNEHKFNFIETVQFTKAKKSCKF